MTKPGRSYLREHVLWAPALGALASQLQPVAVACRVVVVCLPLYQLPVLQVSAPTTSTATVHTAAAADLGVSFKVCKLEGGKSLNIIV